MKQTVYESDFIDAFKAIRPDNFSYQGLHMLFDLLTSYEEASDQELELDVIGICCEFSELTFKEFFEQYDAEMNESFKRESDAIEFFLDEHGGLYIIDSDASLVVFCDAF